VVFVGTVPLETAILTIPLEPVIGRTLFLVIAYIDANTALYSTDSTMIDRKVALGSLILLRKRLLPLTCFSC
jgi:hypothetical protein